MLHRNAATQSVSLHSIAPSLSHSLSSAKAAIITLYEQREIVFLFVQSCSKSLKLRRLSLLYIGHIVSGLINKNYYKITKNERMENYEENEEKFSNSSTAYALLSVFLIPSHFTVVFGWLLLLVFIVSRWICATFRTIFWNRFVLASVQSFIFYDNFLLLFLYFMKLKKFLFCRAQWQWQWLANAKGDRVLNNAHITQLHCIVIHVYAIIFWNEWAINMHR